MDTYKSGVKTFFLEDRHRLDVGFTRKATALHGGAWQWGV